MDKILLIGMSFYGYHGVFPEETKLGQTYRVDIEAYTDLKRAGETDDLQHTINYADLFELTRQIVEGKPYKLIETVAEKIAEQALKTFQIREIVVRVTKPNPPIAGHYEAVAVEIRRKR